MPSANPITPDENCAVNGRGLRNPKWHAELLGDDTPGVMLLIDDDRDEFWLHLILSERKLEEMLALIRARRILAGGQAGLVFIPEEKPAPAPAPSPLRIDDLRPGLTIRFPSGRVFRIVGSDNDWLSLEQIEGPPARQANNLLHVVDVVKRGAEIVAAPEGEGK
jgi:hypothetical protein